MKKLTLYLLLLLLVWGCKHYPTKPFIITGKYQYYDGSKWSDNMVEGLSNYYCNDDNEFVDSSNKYNIGDTIK